MTDSPAVLVDIACDYLDAVVSGQPHYAALVADNYGSWKVAQGMATLLVFLSADAAKQTEATTADIIERMRETYGPARTGQA
jgi:hypothetical protein